MCIRKNMYRHTYVKAVLSESERFDVMYNGHYLGYLHGWVQAYDCCGHIYFEELGTMYILKSVHTRNY